MDTEYKQSRILNGKNSSVRKYARRFLSVGCAFLVALGLGNCQSELCKVTRSGDVNAVQKVLNSGVSAKDLNKAVEIAYKNGNKAVYDQLVKAGAAVAPDFMAGKVFVSKIDELGETEIQAYFYSDLAKQIMDDENFTPEACLPIVQWRRPDDTWSQLKSLTWKNDQKNEFRYGNEYVYESQSYKRVGCNRAIVYYVSYCGGEDDASTRWTQFKYELTFETPTQGYFRGYYNSKYCNVRLFEGRFWLKDAPKK